MNIFIIHSIQYYLLHLINKLSFFYIRKEEKFSWKYQFKMRYKHKTKIVAQNNIIYKNSRQLMQCPFLNFGIYLLKIKYKTLMFEIISLLFFYDFILPPN